VRSSPPDFHGSPHALPLQLASISLIGDRIEVQSYVPQRALRCVASASIETIVEDALGLRKETRKISVACECGVDRGNNP
jgi:hypothetical protein